MFNKIEMKYGELDKIRQCPSFKHVLGYQTTAGLGRPPTTAQNGLHQSLHLQLSFVPCRLRCLSPSRLSRQCSIACRSRWQTYLGRVSASLTFGSGLGNLTKSNIQKKWTKQEWTFSIIVGLCWQFFHPTSCKRLLIRPNSARKVWSRLIDSNEHGRWWVINLSIRIRFCDLKISKTLMKVTFDILEPPASHKHSMALVDGWTIAFNSLKVL